MNSLLEADFTKEVPEDVLVLFDVDMSPVLADLYALFHLLLGDHLLADGLRVPDEA